MFTKAAVGSPVRRCRLAVRPRGHPSPGRDRSDEVPFASTRRRIDVTQRTDVYTAPAT